jgi:hypothetical protein
LQVLYFDNFPQRTIGDVMADDDQAKVRYDDFVSKVQVDPANPQATIMLAGFVGRGTDGQVRIYPDPTLGSWYDVPEADIVHSTPIADAKLGGSYVWIKISAEIKPGGSAAAAPQAAPQAAVAPQAAAAPQLMPTPATHCFICPPLTADCQVQSLHCHTQPVVCDTQPTLATVCTQNCHPTLHSHCFICVPITQLPAQCQIQSFNCPPQATAATVCTQIGCHTAPQLCVHPTLLTQPVHLCPPTQPVFCGIVPPTVTAGCGPQQGAQQAQPHAFAQQAQPQGFAGPAQPAPQAAFSQHICPTPSAVQHCGPPHQTLATICTQVAPCGGHTVQQTHCICPTPSAVQHCGQPPQTPATICTQFGCGGHTIQQTQCICPTPTVIPTHQIVCQQTVNLGCLQTAATPCLPITLGGCTPQSIACMPTPNGVFTPFGR